MQVRMLFLAATAAASVHGQMQSPLVEIGVDGAMTALAFDQGAYELLRHVDSTRLDGVVLAPGVSASLDVERFDVLDDDAVLLRGGAPMARPDQILLRGSVVGVPDSRVFLSLSPHGTNGVVEASGHTYIIADARRSEHDVVAYDLTTLDPAELPTIDFVCGTDWLPQIALAPAQPAPMGEPPCRIAKIAVDTDWEFTSDLFGADTDASAAYALTLMAAESEIYAANFNTHFNITFLRVWDANEDPYGSLDGFVDLQTLMDHWNEFMGDVDRHTVHLLSGKQYSNLGGVAYLPGLCTDFGYGLSGYLNGFFPYPLVDHHPQNWDLFVLGHELGHNFGAPHTHDQSPPVDNCGNGDCSKAFGGTIMSYCHGCEGGMTNIVLAFADQTTNAHVLPYLDSVACPIIAESVTIDEQPQDVATCEGQSAVLSAAASGTDPIAYQWYQDGEAVDGATEATLVIESATPEDAGEYLVIASNGCSEASSDAATVTVGPACAADLNGDCLLDVLDFVELQVLFQAGDAGADINGDGELSILDFVAYQLLFNEGC